MKLNLIIRPLAILALLSQLHSPSLLHAEIKKSEGPVRRYCLGIGSNFGGKGLDTLQYAGSDAKTFSRVMIEMGGVKMEDAQSLNNPSPASLDEAFSALRKKVIADHANQGRSEVVLYYSGHADARGLLLGESSFDYDRFRRKMDSIPADVRIAVLDACASGAITRLKGGTHRPAFTVDASSNMRGYAFITSSSPEEASQESDLIGSSFFTHYLISGLRGAADISGDGKVTLGEAYQFAFHETLARTERTKGGAQHPAYDMKLSGTGDVVMTDMRATSSALTLGKELEGRFFIRNTKGELVVELFKPKNRMVEIGLPPGAYGISLQKPKTIDTASIVLVDGGKESLTSDKMGRFTKEETVSRGLSVNAAEAKYANSFEFGTNRQTEPYHGVQWALWLNRSQQPVNGMQFSVFGNIAEDSIEGGQGTFGLNNAKKGIDGIQGSWFLNIAEEVNGAQISFGANVSHGDLTGLQISDAFNWAHQVKGGQYATVFNVARGPVLGPQLAAISNYSRGITGAQGSAIANISKGDVKGAQVSAIANTSEDVKGVQATAILNVAKNIEGAQVTAVMNIGKNIQGAQVSAVQNIARDVNGAQVTAVLNIAHDVKGSQVGLINISRDLEGGIPFGLINYSHTGLHSANFLIDELGFQHFAHERCIL